MSWGYGSMGAVPFLGFATMAVFIAGFAMPLSYPLGNRLGRRVALGWFLGVLGLMVAVVVASVVWGASSSQLALFTSTFGVSPLYEMTVFGALWLLICGFPTLRSIGEMRE